MEALPQLDRLSVAEKDDLIGVLYAQVAVLTAKAAELEGRLALNSQNSSKPPSSDGWGRPQPKSQRQKGMNSTGGQRGHRVHTLKQVAQPDHLEPHPPASHCDTCHRPLSDAVVVETRQVFDIPPLRHEVTEHRLLEVRCPCGKVHRGAFPAEVTAPVHYGPRIKAAVVHLTHHHRVPVARTGTLTGDLFGLPLSDATVLTIHAQAAALIAPTVAAMGEALKAVPVAHADETGMRVAGKLFWLHVLATQSMTWLGSHINRGKKAFDAFGILAVFAGTLVHDGWKPYRDLACTHALCNAHHLRELTDVFEEMNQAWAKRLMDLLVGACHEVAGAGAALSAAHTTDAPTRPFLSRAPPSIRALRPPASAAAPSRTRRSISSTDCELMPTMSGVSWPITTSPSPTIPPNTTCVCPRSSRRSPAASAPQMASKPSAPFAPISPPSTSRVPISSMP